MPSFISHLTFDGIEGPLECSSARSAPQQKTASTTIHVIWTKIERIHVIWTKIDMGACISNSIGITDSVFQNFQYPVCPIDDRTGLSISEKSML